MLGERERPWPIAVRVVSLPAATSSTKKDANSWCVSFSDSISALTRALVMSSIGLSIRYFPSSSISRGEGRARFEHDEDRVRPRG